MNNIIFFGIVSLLIDLSTEMVYPIIPLYLTSVLGATPTIVGVIEGAAESMASLLKIFSGCLVDKYKNKKLLIFTLYGMYTALTSAAERALITDISPPQLKSTMLGTHATLVGVALLPASVIAGFLWDTFGEAAPFWFGGSLGLIAAIAVAMVLNNGSQLNPDNEVQL